MVGLQRTMPDKSFWTSAVLPVHEENPCTYPDFDSANIHALIPNRVHFDGINRQNEIYPLNGIMLSSIQIFRFCTYKDWNFAIIRFSNQ